MVTIRFAEEALAISAAIGVPFALTTNATNVIKLAVKMTVNIFLYVVQKLSDHNKISFKHYDRGTVTRLTLKIASESCASLFREDVAVWLQVKRLRL